MTKDPNGYILGGIVLALLTIFVFLVGTVLLTQGERW
jgi:hypothetical protein